MKLDNSEPTSIENLLLQSGEAIRAPLNRNGLADYCWSDWMKRIEQVERKQVGEILSDMPHVEDQLRSHVQNTPTSVVWLLVEGIVQPGYKDGKLGCYTYQARDCSTFIKGRREVEIHYIPGWFSKIPFEKYTGFLTGLERIGIKVKCTVDAVGTAKVLHQMEVSAQTEPTTLQRHIKPNITFHPNPHVMTLLGVMATHIDKDGNTKAIPSGVGVELAERLIKEFGSVFKIMESSPETISELVPGMGKVSARKLLEAFGRIL